MLAWTHSPEARFDKTIEQFIEDWWKPTNEKIELLSRYHNFTDELVRFAAKMEMSQ